MAASLFGWDLLYGSVEKDIKTNQDVLVCLTHLVLVSSGFKCIGLGESKNIDGSETKSESLPKGWTDDYAIRYVYEGRLYNLKGKTLEDAVVLNLVRVNERTTGAIQLNVRQVLQRNGTLNEMIPDNKNIVDQIKKELIDKVIVSNKSKNAESQTEQQEQQPASADRYPRYSRTEEERGGLGPIRPLADPFRYGQADLNPFGADPLRIGPRIGGGSGGGGMLFQPPRGGSFPGPGNLGIPPESLPPGARFDPFRPPQGPPNPNLPRRPDNDEFPPPGYDDMYM